MLCSLHDTGVTTRLREPTDESSSPTQRAQRREQETHQRRNESNAGNDWPTFDDFFNNKLSNVELHIIEELDMRFNFIAIRDEIKLLKRSDHHPTPIEHLEYLWYFCLININVNSLNIFYLFYSKIYLQP